MSEVKNTIEKKLLIYWIIFLFLLNIFYLIANFVRIIFIHQKLKNITEITLSKTIEMENSQIIPIFEYMNIFYDNIYSLSIYDKESHLYLIKKIFLTQSPIISIPFKHKFTKNNKEFILEVKYIIINHNYFYFTILSIAFSILFLYLFFYLNLKFSIKKIYQLKKKRQADYYLLYNLFQFLKNFNYQSEIIAIEYYTQQYEKFKFKSIKFYLGGDFIFFNQIRLKNRNFTFFLNADAMGKSLLGLTGIIVLITIIYAVLKRTQNRSIEKERYPETWLKYTSLELEEVFSVFHGYMMISAVLGLLDEENGLLYLINFDHPKPILKRGNDYKFVESKIYKKIGFPEEIQNFEITRIPVFYGDILFIGSDGKDEVLIHHTINQDETFALELLKESNGEIMTFIEKLNQRAKIIDDISMIKITYRNNVVLNKIYDIKNIQFYTKEFDLWTISVKTEFFNLLKNRQYQDIIDKFHFLVENYPFDDNILYWYSYSCRKLKFYTRATEIGERLMNFNKNHKKNIINLIYCYEKMKQESRVDILIKELQRLNFNEKILNKIKKAITK